MAIASVNITCDHCGKTFEHRKRCYNRAEANQHEAWARENIELCPTCYAIQRNAEFEGNHPELPQIEGASAKQIAYASSLRAKYIINHPTEGKWYKEITRQRTPEEQMELEEKCKENGLDPAGAVRGAIEEMGLQNMEIAMTETSARKIIDALK